ncbi:MAG: hypothetical protein IJC18_02685, partial [Clostridia bacterium]|nr:hypothetical protein [Clostridia bacterium]
FMENEYFGPCLERRRSFVAFYILTTYYISRKQFDDLRSMILSEQYDCEEYFRDFPLFYAELSRYIRYCETDKNKYTKLLLQDRRALSMLKGEDCTNVSVSCSFASTVCRMLEGGHDASSEEREQYINEAFEHIEEAIRWNKSYAKYYFLKGKLIFYAKALTDSNMKSRRAMCGEAKTCAEMAHNIEDARRQDFSSRRKEYTLFVERIDEEIAACDRSIKQQSEKQQTGAITQENIGEYKRAIIESNNINYSICPAEYMGATDDERYIFVCYNHVDYKKVYCDLLELSLNKIAFRYDNGSVVPGYEWDECVRKRILSPRCAGVIFYIGETTLLSESSEREMNILREKAEALGCDAKDVFFGINILGRCNSAQIIMRSIRGAEQSALDAAHITGERITTFISTFPDKGSLIPRDSEPDGDEHIIKMISAAKSRFGVGSDS